MGYTIFSMKELIMQLLLANHVLNLPDDLAESIKARVVLAREMFLDDETASGQSESKSAIDTPQFLYPLPEMRKQQIISLSEDFIKKSEKLNKELKYSEKRYKKEYNEEYDTQFEAYQGRIAATLEDYEDLLEAARQSWCSIRPSGFEYNPDDPCHQPNPVPFPNLPEFEFEFDKEIDEVRILDDLTSESVGFLADILGYSGATMPGDGEMDQLLEKYDTYEDLYRLINSEVEFRQKLIVQNSESESRKFKSVGGVLIEVKRQTPPKEHFSYQLCPKGKGRNYNFDLSLVVPDSSWEVISFFYTLHSTGENNTNNYYNFSRIGNTLYFKDLFNQGLTLEQINAAEYLEVTVSFSNRTTLTKQIEGLNVLTCVSGNFRASSSGDDFVPNKYGYKQIGIADYKKVEQSVQCYVAGEISHIENVMASEFREKSTRKLRRAEETLTTSAESEREQLSDTTSVSRFEMQSEVAKLIQESKDFQADTSFNASYGMGAGGKINIGAGMGYATHTSKEDSIRQAITTSKEITERALDRLVTKVKEERVEKIIEEYEENNKHGYDNRGSSQHVAGVYRWVDILYKNQIINYGRRLMFEFMIPEPAKLHLLALEQPEQEEFDLIAPIDPREDSGNKMAKPSDITENIASYWVGKFNVEVKAKPEKFIYIGKSLAGDYTNENLRIEFSSLKDEVQIPEGYKSISATVTLSGVDDGDTRNGKGIIANIGNEQIFDISKGALIRKVGSANTIRNFVRVIPISVTFANYFSGSVNFSIKCELTSEAYTQWQIETFNAIISAYEEKLAEFNEKKEAFETIEQEVVRTNPGFYRKIENIVLRKNCISYMMNRAEGSLLQYGHDMYNNGGFTTSEVKTTARLDTYASFVKFMEQAFEWENISYNFYPFYWANRGNWKNLYNTVEGDSLFHSFLQSGMARVIAPVRPGFEDAVQFYLATGLVWGGGQVPVIGDSLFLSIVDELREIKGEPEGKAWVTRVPTSLTILQAGSIGLDVEQALPCDCADQDEFEDPSEIPCDNGFSVEDSVLGGGETTEP